MLVSLALLRAGINAPLLSPSHGQVVGPPSPSSWFWTQIRTTIAKLKPTKGNEQRGRERRKKETIVAYQCTRFRLRFGLGLPDLRAKRKGTQKGASRSESHVSQTLDQLRQQTREAVQNIKSMFRGPKAGEDLSKDAMMVEWVKQFEELAGS